MKVQVNDAENSQKELVFELPYEVFEKASESELVKIIPTVKIPGFRPGKAPKDVVKKQYAHKIKANAIEKVINDAVQEGLTSNSINPLAQPFISDVEFEEDKPIKFKAKVDVFPALKIETISGFDFERAEIDVTEKDMNEAMTSLQERNMTYETSTTRKDVQNGDVAVIDFTGKIDGKEFEGGAAKAFSLNVGSGQFIPGFEDSVIGMKLGETKDIAVTFPDDYGSKDLAGKPAVFTVVLHEIKEKKLPELNAEFAKTIDPECTSMEILREKLQKGISNDLNNKAKFEAFSVMLNKIIEANPFGVPYSFAKEQAERLAYNSMTQFYQMGLDPEKVGITFEMMVERHITQAQDQVKQALVINDIARQQNIVVDDADVDKFIAPHAEMQGKTLEEMKAVMAEQNMTETIKNDVLGEKVREYLESVNNVKITKMTREEYEAAHAKNNEALTPKKAPKAKKTKEVDSAEENVKEDKTAKDAKPKAPRAAKKKTEKENE